MSTTQSGVQYNLEKDAAFTLKSIFSTKLNTTVESMTRFREVLLNGYINFSVKNVKSY